MQNKFTRHIFPSRMELKIHSFSDLPIYLSSFLAWVFKLILNQTFAMDRFCHLFNLQIVLPLRVTSIRHCTSVSNFQLTSSIMYTTSKCHFEVWS